MVGGRVIDGSGGCIGVGGAGWGEWRGFPCAVTCEGSWGCGQGVGGHAAGEGCGWRAATF